MPKIGLIFFLLIYSTTIWAQSPKWKAWETEADTLLNRGQYKEAIALYTKVIKSTKLKDKDAFASVYKRAVAYYSSEDFSSALQDLNAFIPAYPQVPQAKLLRALVYKGMGDTENQLADLNEVLQYQPDDAGLLKWRASLYLDDGQYELARQDALTAREIEDDAEVEMYLGFALYYLEQPDEALQCINKSISLNPTYYPAYLYGGTFCLEQEDYKKALEYLNLALRLDPENTTAILYKGIALVELNKLDEGCRCLRKAFYKGEENAGDYLKEHCYGLEN
jgi:tetratricopeptide (TPR) repeat protein